MIAIYNNQIKEGLLSKLLLFKIIIIIVKININVCQDI